MSMSHETESENLLKKEKAFLKIITNADNSSLDKSPQMYKGKLPKKFLPTAVIKGTSMNTNFSDKLTKYVDHIKRQGVKTLNYIGKDIMKEMKQEDANFKINTISNIYMTKLQNYSDYISGPNSVIYDKEFIFLDICELACRILYHQQRYMLTDVIIAANISNSSHADAEVEYTASIEVQENIVTGKVSNIIQLDNIKNMTETILKHNTDLRRNEMKYICKKYKICRSYPGFTDYCGYFLSEILRLPEGKFYMITKLLSIILKINEDLMHLISKITYFEIFTTQVDQYFNNETKIKEALKTLKTVLSQKFNIIYNPNLNLKMRAPAVRILLDIIDKSFKGKEHDAFIVDFDTTVAAIKKWANNEISSIALAVGKLCNKIFKILYTVVYSVKTDRKNLIILIEMIKEGTSAQYANHYVNKKMI